MFERFIGQTMPSWKRTLTVVFAVALIIRIIFIFTLQDGFYFADGWKFTAAAEHILQHGAYSPNFDRAPGYPLLLTLVYATVGDSFIGTRIVQAFMGAIVAILIALIGRRVGNYGVGAVAGLLWAIYPMGVFIAGTIYPTTLLTLLLACAVLCLVTRPNDSGYVLRVGLAGILFGLCTLTKPIVLGSIAFVAFWLFLSGRPGRLQLIAVFLLSSFVALLPWTIHNYQIHGRLVPIESRGLAKLVPWAENPGTAAAKGAKPSIASAPKKTAKALPAPSKKDNHTSVTKNRPVPKETRTTEDKATPAIQAAQENTLLPPQQKKNDTWNMVVNMAKRFPSEFVSFFELYPRRVGFLKQEQRERARRKNPELVRYIIFGSDLVMSVSILSVGSLYLFALIGIQAMWRDKSRRRDLGLLFLLVMSFALGYATSWGKIRYRIPVDPYIIILSAWGIMYLSNTIFRKKSQQLEEQQPAG